MANENQNTNANPGLNLNQQSLDLQNLRQGLKDLLDDQGDYNNLLKSSLKDLEKTSTQYQKIQDRLSSLSKESINIKEINQELYKLKQKESDEQKKLTQLQSLYGKKTVSSLETAKKRALEDKKLYESQGASFDLQKQILSNLQEQGNLEAVKIFTQQKQLDFAKQKTKEGQLALENEKNLAKQLGLTGNSAEVLAKKLNIGKEAYATMVAEARKLLEEQKTISQLPQQKVSNSPQQVPAQAKPKQTISQAQAQAQAQQAQAQAKPKQNIEQAQVQAQQAQAQQTTEPAQVQPAPLNNPQRVQPANLNIKKEELDISKSLEQSIRDSRRIQRDGNSDLNKSINLLSQINDLRDQSISKVKSLNKETVNTKDIQREFQKAKDQEELTITKLTNLEKSLGDKEKLNTKAYLASIKAREILEEGIQRARLKGDINAVQSLGTQLNIVDQKIDKAEKELNLGERRYAAAIQANKVASETKNLLQGELNIEKEIQKSVGLTGVALGKVSEKLGLGAKYSEQLVKKARELEDEGKKLTFGDKLSALKKAGVGAIKETFSDPLTAIPAVAGAAVGAYKLVQGGLDSVGNQAAKAGNTLAGFGKNSGTIVRDLASNISSLARNIPLVGGLLGGLVDGFAGILDLMLGVDDYAVKMGRQLNMNAAAASNLGKQYRAASLTNGDIFVTAEKILESQVELAGALGVTNNLGGDILAKNIKLKEFAGLELDTRTKLAEVTKISGKDATDAVLAQVVGLKNATGISFQYQTILKEAAGQSGYLGLQFAKYPAQLTKSLLTVKSMGMELKQIESIADSFLDFESSISKEFEAQLLTGKEINLTKAREAFLNNDLATAAMEITKQVGSTEDFLKLNRIQAESLASAFGMSRDQMGDMLRQQELLAKLGAKQGDSAREQLRLGLEKYKNEKALSEAIGEQAYQSMVNASTQEKLAAMIEKIKESIVTFVTDSGILDKVKEFINYISDPKNVKDLIKKIQGFFADAVEFIGTAAHYILEGLDYVAFGQIPDAFIDSIKSGAVTMGEQIRSLGEGGIQQTKNTVSENAAKDKLKTEAASKKEDNSMSMSKPAPTNLYVSVQNQPIEGKSIVDVVDKSTFESGGGQMNKPKK